MKESWYGSTLLTNCVIRESSKFFKMKRIEVLMATIFTIPAPEEYANFYADYIQRASRREDIQGALSIQIEEILNALDSLTDAQARFRPGPEEWSIKEVTGHL